MTHSGELFAHGGEMGARMRSFGWSTSPLGPVEVWPQSLKTCVRIVLTSRQPMFVWWGDQLINLYNDAYKTILGGKHPEALGQPAAVVWREIWDQVGPRAESAMRGSEGTYDEALLLIMERYGYPEETYYTFSYSPVSNDQGGPGGLLCANTDDTQRILGARQVATLRELAARTADARTPEDAAARSAGVLTMNPRDLPFALIYLSDADRRRLSLAGTAGIAPGSRAAPEEVAVDADSVWPFADVMRTQQARVVTGLEEKLPGLPTGAWERPSREAALVPIAASGERGCSGILVVGLSPFRKFDDSYQGFLDLVSGQIAASVANARAYEEEKQRSDALADLDRAKTAFFSNVSHEFRTPLTLMLGPTEDALASPGGSLRGAELEMVHRNELRLLRLVNTLLDFSRLEAGRVQASYEPTDLSTLTTDLASAFRSAIERGGLRFEVDCPSLSGPVWIDREMWEQIVLNLLSNAFKFTLEGTIGVALRAASDHVELSVRDTGVGISEHEIARLFDRFHRIEGTRSRTHEGSGIGLALVRDLVRLHGGDIQVASELGRGTTFTVSIPRGVEHLPADRIVARQAATSSAVRKESFVQEALRWLPEAGSSRTPAPSQAFTGADRAAPPAARILVADDNADMRDYIARLLRQHWTVEAVADGAQALESARRDPPDLVLTDVMMPVLDGFQLMRELRADPRTAAIPIIAISARAGEEATAAGLRSGADDYLVKPFSARSLLVRVESQLVSARARAEARWAADLERKRLYSLLMDAPAAICIVRGDDLVVELANRGILEVWGKTEAVLGKPLLEGLPEARGQGFEVLLREVIRTGVPRHGHSLLARLDRNRDGTLEDVYFDFVYTPMREHDDRISGVFVFAFDVTAQVDARRAAESARMEAERARAEAESANRAKDEFLAMLGHELRNPLAPILTAVELMQSPDAASNEIARVVIERQVGHMVRLIDDLLDVSRIARGKVELKKQLVEIAEVVAKAIEMASPLLEQREQELTVTVPRRGLEIDGDVTRLAQVVANLLTNAAKYTERNGPITIKARRDGEEVVVKVADAGVGIAPEMLSRVFDMFAQERQTIERSQGGLGLGLAIAQNLVAAHGGTVSAHSAGKGLGSEFTVRLPAARPRTGGARGDEAPQPVAPPAAAGGLRVLVVDDNEDAANLLGIHLRQLGHSIKMAHDGPSALRAVVDFIPDVAFIDIGLPVMDGYELAGRLREAPGLARIRLAAVTGYGQDSDRARARAAGFDMHLVKPVDYTRFKTVIAELTAERS